MIERWMEFTKIVDHLAEDVEVHRKFTDPNARALSLRKREDLKASISKLVRESVGPALRGSAGVEARISLRSNEYSGGRIGPHLTYRTHVETAYATLKELKYLKETKRGVYNRKGGKSFLTKFVATPKLIGLFGDIPPDEIVVLLPPSNDDLPLRIQVKKPRLDGGTKTERIPVGKTPETAEMMGKLNRINRALELSWIDLELSEGAVSVLQKKMLRDGELEGDPGQIIDLSRRSLYRVFNSPDLQRGGRFYGGWWQAIPSEFRRFIRINGKQAIEMDYSGLHPAMLYSEKGLQLGEGEDPYAIDLSPPIDQIPTIAGRKRWETLFRKAVKKAFNAMVNAKTELTRPPSGLRLSDHSIGNWKPKWLELRASIERRHSAISDAFYSDSGARLQRIDSDMAEAVMLEFTQQGSAILPIHDSFLVHEGARGMLKQAMQHHFCEKYKLKISIKADEPAPYHQGAKQNGNTVHNDEFGDPVSKNLEELLEGLEAPTDRRLSRHFDHTYSR